MGIQPPRTASTTAALRRTVQRWPALGNPGTESNVSGRRGSCALFFAPILRRIRAHAREGFPVTRVTGSRRVLRSRMRLRADQGGFLECDWVAPDIPRSD